jgi:hypothetical protein
VLSWDNGTVSVLKRDKAGRTPGTPDTCEFYQQGHRCREPGAGELRGHYMDSHGGFPWTLCAEHVKPGHHPADLRDKLVTW